MRLGWTSTDLAKFIQEESGELTNLTSKYVVRMLDALRKTIPPAEMLLTTQNMTSARKATKAIANGMQELDELNRLYELQMQRITIDVENEKKINKLFNTTGREIFYAMKILKQSSDLKMDLGIAKRQLGEVSVSGQAAIQVGGRYNEGVGKVMADPDSRRKVLGMVETLMSLGARANLDAAELVQSAASFSPENVIDIEPNDETPEDPEPSMDMDPEED